MEGLRSSRRSSRRLMAEINVVPYIDVMLVLVVILMVAAPFVNPSLVNLPSVKKAEKAPEVVVEVIVHPTGALSVRKGKSYSLWICRDLLLLSKTLRPAKRKYRW